MVSVTTSKVLDIEDLISPDHLATSIATQWRNFNNHRSKWIEEKKELRNYLFATDTRTTSNSRLPWANSTTTPKLAQIRDNLHANYLANLFPNSKWLRWKGLDSESQVKASIIQEYMRNKLVQDNFIVTASKLVSDYIDYGNCFGMVEFVNEQVELEDGEIVSGYVGPRAIRISPFDIAFDPTAVKFEDSPKIIKKIVGLGDIRKAIDEDPVGNAELLKVFEEMVGVRNLIRSTDSEIHKGEGFTADGFGNLQDYYNSDYVELLTFYGNLYNTETGELLKNHEITIADRAYLISKKQHPSWNGVPPIRHAGWRDRPDNLYAMGPLDNLVGLQYRIDHLENMKADVWDQISYPIKKVRGEVEEFTGELGEIIYLGDEGDVQYLVPDATALNADLQIERLQALMEELAGAPRESMGIRTPGEKTAFEINTLSTAANRIYRHKTAHLEMVFFEPLINDMLEVGRRNMQAFETIEMVDEETGISFFDDITKEDITSRGKLYPIGARHLAERNTRVQNLLQVSQMKAGDPSIGVHISGKKIAEILAHELQEPELYQENIGVIEQFETQSVGEEAQVDFEEQQIERAESGE